MSDSSSITAPDGHPSTKENCFSIIKIEGGMCQLLSSDYLIVSIPCKYVPFKALRVGETVRINFQRKH